MRNEKKKGTDYFIFGCKGVYVKGMMAHTRLLFTTELFHTSSNEKLGFSQESITIFEIYYLDDYENIIKDKLREKAYLILNNSEWNKITFTLKKEYSNNWELFGEYLKDKYTFIWNPHKLNLGIKEILLIK